MILAATLALTLASGGCDLDTATVSYTPPNTAQILATYRCGGITCWARWIETDGKRMGASRVCERDSAGGDGGALLPVPVEDADGRGRD